jgi:hypothetical protein
MKKTKVNLPQERKGAVNICTCFFCGNETGAVTVGGARMDRDTGLPEKKKDRLHDGLDCCADCAKEMRKSIIFLEIRESMKEGEHFVPTGKRYVVREDVLQDVVKSAAVFQTLKRKRYTVVSAENAKLMKLNREKQDDRQDS